MCCFGPLWVCRSGLCFHVRTIMSRKSVQKLEDDLKQLKAEQALTVKETTTTDPHLQDQVRQEVMFLRDR